MSQLIFTSLSSRAFVPAAGSRRAEWRSSSQFRAALRAPVRFLRLLWHTDPLLTGTGLVLIALLIPFGAGLALDPRSITGAPAWLKPFKFALSTGTYTLTLAWLFSFLRNWPRLRRHVGRLTAGTMLLEVAIIALQAARGVPSHFNVSTLFDGVLFTAMGLAIFAQTTSSTAVAVALWRERHADAALGWALRFGMAITILGGFSGGLMTRPTPAQMGQAQLTGRLSTVGAHTVGAPDGGPGLPVTGWSTRHGDLRVAHFVGLHAMQALPLIALVFFRRGTERFRKRAVLTASAGYFLLFIGLLLQALAGSPFIALD